jgi:small multidrug resistance pump
MVPWLALVATILCSTGGNTFANWSHDFTGRKRLLVLGSAASVHGFGLLCFSVALTGIPLAIAYPVLIGGSVACVSLLAVLLFGERMTFRQLVGLVLIVGGMLLLHGTDGVAHAQHLPTPHAQVASAMPVGTVPTTNQAIHAAEI